MKNKTESANVLTITVYVEAHTSKTNIVKKELKKLSQFSQTDEGCIYYDLYQDQRNKSYFIIHEKWKTRASWKKHMESKYLADYALKTQEAIKSFSIYELDQIA